jgi:RNA polymerase sigma-70 factor (ECF subfamily)
LGAELERHPLADVLCEAAGAPGWKVAERSELERALAAGLARATAQYPDFVVSTPAFVRFVAQRLPETNEPPAALARLRWEELYLAFACLARSPKALALLEKSFVGDAIAALRRLGLSESAREEALQRAREKLLTGGGEAQPKLTQYSGQGSLAGWIRVVVVRTALNALRAERRHAPRDDDALASRIAADGADPEIEVMRARYSQTLTEAVAEAFRKLSSEQRNLLRMYVIDRLTVTELGRLHGVDPSTISRWLARIRGKLLEEARNQLLERFGMRPSECESVMRAIRTGLHVTVERLLATEEPETGEE